MSGVRDVVGMNIEEPSVDHCEMLTTIRSGRVAVGGVDMSDVVVADLIRASEHLPLTAAEADITERSSATAASTTGDVSTSGTVPDELLGLPHTESECHELPEELDQRLAASGPLSANVDDQGLVESHLEQLENVQVAIKVFLGFSSPVWTCALACPGYRSKTSNIHPSVM